MSSHNAKLTEMASAGVLTVREVETSAGALFEARLQVDDSAWLARAGDVVGVLAAVHKRWSARPTAVLGCKSGKVEYPTEHDADQAAAATTKTNLLSRHGLRTRVACRSYRCPDCGHWHVTSEPPRITPVTATPSTTAKESA